MKMQMAVNKDIMAQLCISMHSTRQSFKAGVYSAIPFCDTTIFPKQIFQKAC